MKSADTQFHSRILTTDTELKYGYRLRYRVFVEQCGFEPANESRFESDDYDKRAVHIGLLRKDSAPPLSLPIGYLRLVLPNHEPPSSLPGQQAYASQPEAAEKFNELADAGALEVSRICKQRKTPTSAMLYLQACAMVLGTRLGVENSIAVMEPAYARQLGFAGIELQQIAPLVNYHGKRAGYMIPTKQASFARRHRSYMREAAKDVEGNLQRIVVPQVNFA